MINLHAKATCICPHAGCCEPDNMTRMLLLGNRSGKTTATALVYVMRICDDYEESGVLVNPTEMKSKINEILGKGN